MPFKSLYECASSRYYTYEQQQQQKVKLKIILNVLKETK